MIRSPSTAAVVIALVLGACGPTMRVVRGPRGEASVMEETWDTCHRDGPYRGPACASVATAFENAGDIPNAFKYRRDAFRWDPTYEYSTYMFFAKRSGTAAYLETAASDLLAFVRANPRIASRMHGEELRPLMLHELHEYYTEHPPKDPAILAYIEAASCFMAGGHGYYCTLAEQKGITVNRIAAEQTKRDIAASDAAAERREAEWQARYTAAQEQRRRDREDLAQTLQSIQTWSPASDPTQVALNQQLAKINGSVGSRGSTPIGTPAPAAFAPATSTAGRSAGSGSLLGGAGIDDRPKTDPACASCGTRCEAQHPCEKGANQSACYAQAACVCRCILSMPNACGFDRSSLETCVTNNEQNVSNLRSNVPSISTDPLPPARPVVAPSPVGTPPRPSCPGCAGAAK